MTGIKVGRTTSKEDFTSNVSPANAIEANAVYTSRNTGWQQSATNDYSWASPEATNYTKYTKEV